ncbi:MAG: NUDIX hydrolase [Chloroflexi bacterium]|nr:NUDIX hydrolase [Chloroflexota bacterium]MBP8057376.1 NUDIX hydrolase [Chloroflexota bacterium]
MSPFHTLTSQIAWSCPWYSVRQDQIILPNGQPGVYNVIVKDPAVWIIPVTTTGHIALIYTYRHTIDDWCWEIPAGSVKPEQTVQEAAIAELREEVGGTTDQWSYVTRFYPANGICNEIGHIFLATGVTLSQPAHEPAEVIQIHTKPITEVLQMAQAGYITDGPSALALLITADKLRSLV